MQSQAIRQRGVIRRPLSPASHRRRREEQRKLYPDFPINKKYDVILLDPPHKYDVHTQPGNIPDYDTLTLLQLMLLPIRAIAKEDAILLMWCTAPMLNKAMQLIKSFGFRYVTVFQTWVKKQNGDLAKIKGNYSYAQTEYLLWADKGRTQHLRTPDIVDQVLTSDVTKHSEKPTELLFPRLMQKLHLNKCKCLEIFAREKKLQYFDVYGNQLVPQFQEYVQSLVNVPNELEETQPKSYMPSIAKNDDQMPFKNDNIEQSRLQQILSKFDGHKHIQRLTKIFEKFQHTIALSKSELGISTMGTHKIRLKEGAMPKRSRPYRLSPLELDFLNKEIGVLEELGFIERCEATWTMPTIMVKKVDTTDLRMCIDFRDLNKWMVVENYPIPRIDEILSTLSKGKYFTKIDLKSGFWQIQIDPDSLEYVGFITPKGVFRWKVMPFGLKNAPATFQRIMESVLRKYLDQFCMVYIDDILIYSDTLEEHEKHIQLVMSALQDANLKIGIDKCNFFMTSIDILGHHITHDTILPQNSKTQAIWDMPIPLNKSQVRTFIGMCSYYRTFIQDFSQKCAPLHNLTKLNTPFEWSKECNDSFNILKQELCDSPLLSIPDPQGTFVLQTDFSERGIGAVLSQLIPNKPDLRVIEYASRSLRGAEINYPAYEGEVLAIHWALEKFRHYLHGRQFILQTDNKALQQVLENSSKSKKIIRWIMDLQEYQFTTSHRSGVENANADALSRLLPLSTQTKFFNGTQHLTSITCQNLFKIFKNDDDIDIEDLNYTYMTEGVGNLPCSICHKTHTRDNMLICDCCGLGYHGKCLEPQITQVPDDSYYCKSCLDNNEKIQKKDITMDFNCIDYLKNDLDINKFDTNTLTSIRKRSSYYRYMYGRIFRNTTQGLVLVPTIAERRLLTIEQHKLLQHPSPQRLLAILSRNFWWNNMLELIEEVTYDCQVCQCRKLANVPSNHYIPTNKGHEPFHTISMDLAPELVVTEKGNRHLLVIVDNFSKFTLLLPVKDKSSQTMSDAVFNNLICLFGKPKKIRVDQGNEFKGEFSLMAERWGIHMDVATTYHPQANGLAEKQIDTVKRALTAAINDPDQPLDWDEACYPIQMSINSALSRATSLSPYQVVFGRYMDVPQSIIYGLPLEQFQEPTPTEVKTYHKKLTKFLKDFHLTAQQQRAQTDKQNQKVYNAKHKNVKQIPFQPNQLVFVKRANRSRWALPNIGPFIFEEYTSKTKKSAQLRNPATGVISKQAVQNLSPWKIIQIENEQEQEQEQEQQNSMGKNKGKRPSDEPFPRVDNQRAPPLQSPTQEHPAPVSEAHGPTNQSPPAEAQEQSQQHSAEVQGPSQTNLVATQQQQGEAHEPTLPPLNTQKSVLNTSRQSPRANPDNLELGQLTLEQPDAPMEDPSNVQGHSTSTPLPAQAAPNTESQDTVSAQDFVEHCKDLREFRDMAPESDEETLRSFEEFINGSLAQPLSATQRIKRKPLERILLLAIAQRRSQLAQPTQQPQAAQQAPPVRAPTPEPRQPQEQGTYSQRLETMRLEYDGLTRFQTALLARSTVPGSYSGAAQDQLTTFLRPNSIVLGATPAMSYSAQFSGVNVYRHQLTRDQIAKIQLCLQPTVKDQRNQVRPQQLDNPQMRLPTFNPDFQFPFTLLFVQEKPSPFTGYTDVHRSSQEALNNQRKPQARLNSHQLEATWSFDQDVRWVCVQIDPALNSLMTETLLFFFANRVWPMDAKVTEVYGRCTTFRCGHTLAMDGRYWLVYCSNALLLRNVYQNLLTRLSPILMTNGRVFLVQPSRFWPTKLGRLPAPQQYEQLIPTVNVWSLLNKTFLSPQFQHKFTPCLFAGGVYLPLMACRSHCVHGKTILQMPVFASRTQSPVVEPQGYYNWDCASAKWTPVDASQVTTSVFYQKYMTPAHPDRVYGSWHFHTCWKRDDPSLKVALTPGSWMGQVSSGLSVAELVPSEHPFISQVILGHTAKLQGPQKREVFEQFVAAECASKPEWAFRFRRLGNFIAISQPGQYLSWQPANHQDSMFTKQFFPDQIPGVYEIIHSPPPAAIAFFKNRPANNWSDYQFVPKPLAANFDPQHNTFNPNTAQLLQRRYASQQSHSVLREVSLPQTRPATQEGRNSRYRPR